MKKTVFFLIIAVTTAIISCQKKEDDNNINTPPAAVAATPQPCNHGGAQPNCQYVNNQPNPNYGGYNTNGYYPYYNNGAYNGYYYNNQYYNYNQSNSWYYGSWYWPTQWNSGTGCMSGYQPTCSQGFGVACAPSTYFSTYNVIYFNYGYTYPNQNSPYNANPQMSYQGTGCPTQAAQSCDTRANNCPSGSTCQASGGGSIYGICITNP